jgi:hypothetical protein
MPLNLSSPEPPLKVIPAILTFELVVAFVVMARRELFELKLSMMTVWSFPPTVDRLPAPRIESVVEPDGIVRVTWVAHPTPPEQAGMFTVVVELTTELNAV